MNAPPRGRKPVDIDDLFPGRYMKAGQLGERKHTFTIADVQLETLPDDKGGERGKGVIFFREVPYAWVVNKTNSLCIRAMFGRTVDAWVGKRITLFRGEYKGDYAIRVWGSPEIRSDMQVKIKLPKRKDQTMTMHAVGPADASRQQPVEPHPTEGRKPDDGPPQQ